MRFELRHGKRERVAQTFDHLKQREIDVTQFFPENERVVVRVVTQNPLEIAEKLGYAVGSEMAGALFGLGGLFLVVENVGDWMVRLARFIEPIGDGQLQLMGPEAACLRFSHQTQTRREKLKNVRGLGDQDFTGL